jgi:molecular chaperone DnaK (HSP70)
MKAIELAGLTIDDIDAAEILGGALRIPKIQALMAETLQVNCQINVI